MRNRLPIAVVLLVVAVVVVVLWTQPPSAAAAPLLRWSLGGSDHAAQFATAKPEQPLRLHWKAREPLYVYVASFSQTDGTLALFPSTLLTTDVPQPVPTGEHTLPATNPDKPLHWPVRGGVPGATDYVVVASRQPLPELDAALRRCRQFSNTTFPDGSLVFSNPKDLKADEVAGRTALPHPLLLEAQKLAPVDPNGPMSKASGQGSIWLASFKLAPVTGQ